MPSISDDGFEVLKDCLARGLDPNDEAGGCSAIQSWLTGIDWVMPSFGWEAKPQRRNIDTEHARNRIKAIHLVARHGGRWTPDEDDIKTARRTLLKMTPDYTAELVWIMSKYRCCRHGDLVALLASPTMRKHIVSHRERIDELLQAMQAVAASRQHCEPSAAET